MDKSELVRAVKAHALANYATGGWDIVVEAYDAAELAKEIGDATTVEAAIAKVGEVVEFLADMQRDRMAEADDHYRAAGELPFWGV